MSGRTPQERAAWALSRACNGWRRDRVCRSSATGQPLVAPHPACVRAQEEHDQILRDAGVARPDPPDPSPVR
jgi:hypothetical protein